MTRAGYRQGRCGMPAAGMLAILVLGSAAQAGLVVTASSRQNGAVVTQPEAIRCGEAPVKWADVLLAFNDPVARRPSTNETLRFRNGEVWHGTVDALAGGSVQAVVAGARRTVAAGTLLALDFRPNATPVEGPDRGVMYRQKGKPVPGALLWIDGARVGLDSPLGAVALERKDLKRYVFADADESLAPSSAGGDEIGLSDGSVLRGELTPDQDGFAIQHPVLGSLRAGPDTWLWVRRHRAGVTYLNELTPAVETFPLILRNAPAPRVVPAGAGETYASRLQISPKTNLRYVLPGQAGGTLVFHGALALGPGSRGAAQVRIASDGRSLFEQTLQPSATLPVDVSVEAAGGSALTLDVDFDREVRLPCVVVLDDAFVAAK